MNFAYARLFHQPLAEGGFSCINDAVEIVSSWTPLDSPVNDSCCDEKEEMSVSVIGVRGDISDDDEVLNSVGG